MLTPAERTRRYRNTENGRAVQRAYAKTEKAKAAQLGREKRSGRNTSARISVSRRAAKQRWTAQRQAEMYGRVNAIKLDRGCADCGYSAHAVALDFDHVNGDKLTNVASLVGRLAPWPLIEAEIAKCEVVCANCHRVRTVARRYARAERRTPKPNHPQLF